MASSACPEASLDGIKVRSAEMLEDILKFLPNRRKDKLGLPVVPS